MGEGMIGAYVDRAVSRLSDLGSRLPVPVRVDEASGLLATLLERLGIPIDEAGAGLALSVSTDGRTLASSLPEDSARQCLAHALTTNPAAPSGPGQYCVDPAFVLDADAITAGAALALMTAR